MSAAAARPYDRADQIRRDLPYVRNLLHARGWGEELLGIIADQRAQISCLLDEQWSEAYRSYLQSPNWQTRREAALLRAGFSCELCGTKEPRRLQVHHRDYLRAFHETPTDLIVLCGRCHRKHHGRDS